MAQVPLKNNQSADSPARTTQFGPGLFRFSMPQFLAALIILVVAYPFVDELNYGEFIENMLMMILLASAVLAVGGKSWVLTILLVLPALAGPWLHRYVPVWIITGTHMLFVGFVIAQLLKFILRATRVNGEVMCAGIAGYLMLGLLWTPTYLMISQLDPASFSGVHEAVNHSLGRFDALYLSFVTLTGLGCNDISPLSKIARMLLMVESMTGVLYLAILIARLVALYSRPGRGNPDSPTRA